MMKLAALIDSEFRNIKKETDFISRILHLSANKPLDEIPLRAASLSLIAIYNGMEKILVQLLLHRGIRIKETLSWHTEVLRAAAAEKIITEDTQKEMSGFLSFRHFIRHAYSFEIDPNTVEAILKKAPQLTHAFFHELSIIVDKINAENNE